MDPQVAIAAISAITAILLGFFKMWVDIQGVHKLVNSRMTELLELTRVAAVARGRLDVREVGQDRVDVPSSVQALEDPGHRAPEESRS